MATPPDRALARRRPSDTRSFELDVGVEEAIQRLRDDGGIPIAGERMAERPPTGRMFMEIEGDRFVIRAPFSAGDTRSLGSEVGPALEGRLVSTDYGARLDIELRRLSPTRSQSAKLWALVVVTGMGVASLLAAGAIGDALLIGGLVLALLAVPFVAGHLQSRRRSLELLAVVQRALGPVGRVKIDELYRKRALEGPK